MVFDSLHDFKSAYEGCEKKLDIEFSGKDIRKIGFKKWEKMLKIIKCSVLSQSKNSHLDSFVLSESSLFLYSNRLILKTCSTTNILGCLDYLLKFTSLHGSVITTFQFYRTNFAFRDSHPYLQKSFEAETSVLNKYFEGETYFIGSESNPQLNIYFAKTKRLLRSQGNTTLELVMFDLDPEKLKKFVSKSGSKSSLYDGKTATNESGIALLFPSAIIDSFLFSPCGYSCNGLIDSNYFTIHVTPEPECSFASFETNIPIKQNSKFVRDTIRLFSPTNFTVFHMVPSEEFLSSSCFINMENFICLNTSTNKINSRLTMQNSHFRILSSSDSEKYGSMRFKADENNDSTMCTTVVNNLNLVEENNVEFLTLCDEEFIKKKKEVLSFLENKFFIKKINKNTFNNKRDVFGQTIRDLIFENEADEGFSVIDVSALLKVLFKWTKLFSNIRPYFNLKYYTNPLFILALSRFGCGFTCFSPDNVETLINLGVNKNSIIISNPWLSKKEIESIISKGVLAFSIDSQKAFDNIILADSFAQVASNISLILFLGDSFDDPPEIQAVKLKSIFSLVENANKRGVRVNSFSFSRIPGNPKKSIKFLTSILEQINLSFNAPDGKISLNLGPETLSAPYNFSSKSIEYFKEHFKNNCINKIKVELLAELSHFFVKPILTNVVNIISVRKDRVDKDPMNRSKKRVKMNYFVDDGIYQNFLFVKTSNSVPEVVPKPEKNEKIKYKQKKRKKRKSSSKFAKLSNENLFETVIWGRTCDNIDCIVDSVLLPKLDSNDWLYFRKIEADSMNTMTEFNGFKDIKNTQYIFFEDN